MTSFYRSGINETKTLTYYYVVKIVHK